MTGRLIADDLFAGAGGWDLAADALGIRVRRIENMPEANATAEAAGFENTHDDVWTWADQPGALSLASIGIGSAPCQTFSPAGSGSGRKALDVVLSIVPVVEHVTLPQLRNAAKMFPDPKTGKPDERTALVLTPLWYALHHSGYRALAWEQVPTVLPVWQACAEVLRTKGWNVWVGYVYSEQYGVPQTRKRAVLIASRDREVGPPPPTHSRYYSRSPEKLDEGVEKWVSMAEALGWGMTQRPYPTVACSRTSGGPDKEKVGGSAGRKIIYDELAAGRWADFDGVRSLGSADYREPTFRSMDQPSPTVTGSGRNVGFAWVPTNRELDVDYDLVKQMGAGMVERHGNRPPRTMDEPAFTVTGAEGGGSIRVKWEPTPAIEGESAADITWPHDRPSPTIVGSFAPDVVAAPGYRKAGDPPRQKTPGSVRITLEEAALLQSFPIGFRFSGGPKDSSGKKFMQVGNAVPPLMGLHILAEANGLPLPKPLTSSQENVA